MVPAPAASPGGDGQASQQELDDSVFGSAEFQEYEREFRKYTQENLRSQQPTCDFAEVLLDSGEQLSVKLVQLVEWWRTAKHVVVYTGAGLSTAAGLPDYRGPQGVWTRKLRGEAVDEQLEFAGCAPTSAHTALAHLHSAGLLAHVVTTNCDNLHSKAGLPGAALSELHGNAFVEECGACGERYERERSVRTASGLFEHETGGSCETCGGALRDTIVNFGNTFEHVPSMELQHDRAWLEMRKADLVVVLGSSLSVPTACDLPEECLQPRYQQPQGGRLVIVNLQRTPKDALATLRIFAPCDEVVTHVEHELLACGAEE